MDRGASSLADIQRQTTACTRCFGCRFELERMLQAHLGESYRRTKMVTPPQPRRTLRQRLRRPFGVRAALLPARMYMPVLAGYRGRKVETRVVIVHWYDDQNRPAEAISVRGDLLALDGTRLKVWQSSIAPCTSAILDVRELLDGDELPAGVGVLKLVIEAEEVSSLRPYFQFVSDAGITSTHEKKGPRRPEAALAARRYHWLFPIASSPAPEEAYFFFTNTVGRPMDHHRLIWRTVEGAEESLRLPPLELDQSACVPLQEHFPEIGHGTAAGSVRLEPSPHVAGFMIRYDARGDLWRVQHL